MDLHRLIQLGFDTFFQQQLNSVSEPGLVPARVMGVHRSGLELRGDGFQGFRELATHDTDRFPTIGDWVLWEQDRQRIARILDRKSLFRRRAPGGQRSEQNIAANVDSVFIVSSCNADFNEARLERYLAIARESDVMPIIVLTKADQCDNPGAYARRARRLAHDVQVETVNALENDSLAVLQPWLGEGQTIALLGSSGVGKSTIINTLSGKGAIRTQSIRANDAKGRHTTTSRSMHPLDGGAWLVDTPGMRELQLVDVSAGLSSVFDEISSLTRDCRFSDCQHDAEPGCAVQKAIATGKIDAARLERWRKLVREDARNSESLAERRARDRSTGRFYKSIIDGKNAQKKRI